MAGSGERAALRGGFLITALVTDLTHPIGRHILDAAAARGQPCKVLASAEDLDETRGAELVTGTIDDDAALLAAVRDVDVVYHTALIAQGTPDKLRRVNVDGTRRLLEACAGDIRRFVLISTPAVYASHPTPIRGRCWPTSRARRTAPQRCSPTARA